MNTAELKVKIQTPRVPNYVQVQLSERKSVTLSIKELSDDQIRVLGQEFTRQMLDRAHELQGGTDHE